MGREVRRVALDFDWPVGKTWVGFLNPYPGSGPCHHCDSTGYSPTAERLADQWYGKAPFRPEDRGSEMLTIHSPPVRAFAERNVKSAPAFYGNDDNAVDREAKRLIDMWNHQWNHHVNADDIAALVEAGRLMDFTHTWTKDDGWVIKDPPYVPTPAEVNAWSIGAFGHDSINQWVVVKAECARLGVGHTCEHCEGHGEVWPSQAAKAVYEGWEPVDPPAGEGYQIWETVSEGSPISPVFSTAEDLARHMAKTSWGADEGTPYETWLEFINGPGWAPSMVVAGGVLMNGVEAAVQ